MKAFFQLLGNEFRRIFSNGVVIAIFFGAPIMYAVLVGYVYKKGKVVELPIAVIDYDQTPLSDRVIDALDDNENIKIAKVYFDNNEIRKDLIQYDYQAVVTIPKHFEGEILQKRYPEISVDINTGNILTANYASRGVQTVLTSLNVGFEMESLKKQGLSTAQAKEHYESFKISINRLFNAGSNYMEFLWPGVIGIVMQQVFLLVMALSFARDFEDGYFKHTVKFSRSAFYHLSIKIVPVYLLGTLVWILVGCMFSYFDIAFPVFSSKMALLAFLFTTACMFLGILVSLLIPNQLKATEILMIIATPSFIIGGFTWPLEAMSPVVQSISNCIPSTPFLQGFRKLMVYGGELSDIKTQLISLIWIMIVSISLSVIVLQVKIFRTKKSILDIKL
jgi:ABC-2 type transport system permease protein